MSIQIERAKKAEHRTRSELVREALRQYLALYERDEREGAVERQHLK